MIQEKLDSLQPYITGIRYIQGLQLVDAVFKDGWIIPDSDTVKKEKVEENYYMFYSDVNGVTIDTLLDYVKGIIDINIERENKHEFLKEKVVELQTLFKNNSLTKLKTLKFIFEEFELTPTLLEFDEVKSTETTQDSIKEETYIDEYDDEDEEEKKARLMEEENFRQQQEMLHEKFNNGKNRKNKMVANVELPPRNKKIEVEVYDIPEEFKQGECDCGPEQACAKCMDKKDL